MNRICLTPTRNEAWILSRFLAAVEQWASHLIVVDQLSNDGTREQLRANPKVDLVVNDSPVYDEAYRQNLLIGRARKIPGSNVLIALDADEALSANAFGSKEWDRIYASEPGTVLRFRWVNILPGFKQAWIPPNRIACGYIDDGSDHRGTTIHSRRVPWPDKAPVLDLDEIVVLHFQYVAWDRVISKHRWYQAWEHIQYPAKSALEIFRAYHHMDGSWKADELFPVDPNWLAGYENAGVHFQSLTSEPVTWWDREILRMLEKHGPEFFRRFAIWDKDWSALALQFHLQNSRFGDPRNLVEKTAHRLLKVTQKHRSNWGVRAFERSLRALGW